MAETRNNPSASAGSWEQVTAEQLFDNSMESTPQLQDGSGAGWCGVWQRWQGLATEQLLAQGESLYAFQFDRAQHRVVAWIVDRELPVRDPRADGAAAAAAGTQEASQAKNEFGATGCFFQPALPLPAKERPPDDFGLRVWPGGVAGTVMGPTEMPSPAPADAGAAAPFILNFYIREPGHEGEGARWGWNVQYEPSPSDPQVWEVAHVNHTRLHLIRVTDPEQQLQPGAYRPVAEPQDRPDSIDKYVAEQQQQGALQVQGSATGHRYSPEGRLLACQNLTCSWDTPLEQLLPAAASSSSSSSKGQGQTGHTTGSEGAAEEQGPVEEVWYMSKGYLRVPKSFSVEQQDAGQVLLFEAGAILRDGSVNRVRICFKGALFRGLAIETYPAVHT